MLEGSNFRKADQPVCSRLCDGERRENVRLAAPLLKPARLNHFDADSLRYYYTAKLSSRIDDIDLSSEDFVQRVNADIVNKVVNWRPVTLALSISVLTGAGKRAG